LGTIEFTNEIMLEVHNIQGCHVEIHGEICNDFGSSVHTVGISCHSGEIICKKKNKTLNHGNNAVSVT